MPRILFVSGFHPATRARDLAFEFERYGPLVRCDVPAPRNPHASSNPYAFVEFRSQRDAEDAYTDMHGRYFEGSRLSIQWAKNPPSSVWRYERRSSPPPARARSRSPPRRRPPPPGPNGQDDRDRDYPPPPLSDRDRDRGDRERERERDRDRDVGRGGRDDNRDRRRRSRSPVPSSHQQQQQPLAPGPGRRSVSVERRRGVDEREMMRDERDSRRMVIDDGGKKLVDDRAQTPPYDH